MNTRHLQSTHFRLGAQTVAAFAVCAILLPLTSCRTDSSAPAAKTLPLSALDLSLMSQGYGKPGVNQSLEGKPLQIAGARFDSGVASHAEGQLTVALDGKATRFSAVCGIDDDAANEAASAIFSVEADGKTVWHSPVMKSGRAGVPVSVPLKGVRMLALKIGDAGDGIRYDHADWANASIDYTGAAPAAVLPPPPPERWLLSKGISTDWKVAGTQLPHSDFIEQGGRRTGQKVWYTVDADGALKLERDVVWPSLRIFPNDTHGSLIKHYAAEAEPAIAVDGTPLGALRINEVRLDGTLTFLGQARTLSVKRVTFPAFEAYAAIDRWTLTNAGDKPATVAVAPLALSAAQPGPYGTNVMEVACDAPASTTLKPKESLTFTVRFCGRLTNTPPAAIEGAAEEAQRRAFIARLNGTLILETPDPVLNRAFAFAKWRVAEAMNDTRGGLMLAPGNLRYYAATWCNDNVEYAGPFFPFLGEEGGNKGSLNTYRQYLAYMKPTYERIPWSVIAEGTDAFGLFDRGDAAMYAYGASRFSLALGDRAVAEELWKGIVWSLEYCRRQQTPEGVIASDADELEKRLPAGKANLNTASLCYGGLRSAANLGRALGKAKEADAYDRRADALAQAIENHFGSTVEGFNTYRYYDGNDRLRSWICMPLSMGLFDRKQATIDALFSSKMWTLDGLASQSGDRVFWDRSTLYALRAVFQAGETAKALDFLSRYTRRRLLGEHVPYAVEAYPEGGQGHLASESGLYCRIYIEGLFGVLPTGLDRFRCTPRLPEGWPSAALRHVKAFGRDFDLEVSRSGKHLNVKVTDGGHTVLKRTIEPGQSLDVAFPDKR